MQITFDGAAGKLHIGDFELYVDNQSRKRSGHMSHAMVEYLPGKIIAFNSNCSAERLDGHSAFGWMEYRYSEDYGRTWGEIKELEYSKKLLLDGVYTMSVEKAVIVDGVITIFAVRNTQFEEICCEPWDTPIIMQSHDYGKTWSDPVEFSSYKGRIYDAVVKDNKIYALEVCNENHVCKTPDNLYRLFRSDDGGKSFHEVSIVDTKHLGHAYGALLVRKDGALLAYANNIENGFELDISISMDNGTTWKQLPTVTCPKGIRNVQVSALEDGYIMHGRAIHKDAPWGQGFVFYSSKDGIQWDEGVYVEEYKRSCYYSNNLLIREPGCKERLLVQYSDTYGPVNQVNVCHLTVTLE